jgi:hypothetical protein
VAVGAVGVLSGVAVAVAVGAAGVLGGVAVAVEVLGGVAVAMAVGMPVTSGAEAVLDGEATAATGMVIAAGVETGCWASAVEGCEAKTPSASPSAMSTPRRHKGACAARVRASETYIIAASS